MLGQNGFVGINQHDRAGIDKASAWHVSPTRPIRCSSGSPDRVCLTDAEVSRASYPARGTHDPSEILGRQPYVTGVTSYSPNKRGEHHAKRGRWIVSSVSIPSVVASDVEVFVVGSEDLAVGDKVFFSGVQGGYPRSSYLPSSAMTENPQDAFNCGEVDRSSTATDLRVRSLGPCENEFTVTSIGSGDNAHRSFAINFWEVNGVSLDATAAGYAARPLDFSGSFVHRAYTVTDVNPAPTVAEHGWSYETGDRIYITVSFSTPVVVTGSPRLRLHTGHHFEVGAADAYAVFVGGGYGESKSFWKNNEPNPLRSGRSDINSYHQQLYDLDNGGCTQRRSWVCDDAVDQDAPASPTDSCYDWARVNPTTPISGTPNLWCTGINTPAGCETRITTSPAAGTPYIHAGTNDEACDDYGGITRTADARVRTRGCHDLQVGDLIIIEGVVGLHADLLNKMHTVGKVGCRSQAVLGSDNSCPCNDEFAMEPPLNLLNPTSCSGYSACEFDAGNARVGRVNIGSRCRSGGLADPSQHGDRYCTFSTFDRYMQGDAVLSTGSVWNADVAGQTLTTTYPSLTHNPLPDYSGGSVTYTSLAGGLEAVPGGSGSWGTQTGRRHSASGASFGFRADANAGTIPTLRREQQFPEIRKEQSMDHTLVFEYVVESQARMAGSSPPSGADDYNQQSPSSATGQTHLSADLDVSSISALELNGGTISRACPFTYIVESVEVTANGLRLKLIGRHELVPGEYVRIENAGGTHRFKLNGLHEVLGIFVYDGSPGNPGSTKVIVSSPAATAAPPFDRQGSQAATHGESYLLLPTPSGLSIGDLGSGAIVAGKTIVRRFYNFEEGGHQSCVFASAILTLPRPGDKLSMRASEKSGAVSSLSYNKDLVIGRAHVTSVTSDSADGTYGYNDGINGVRTVADVIDIQVIFSEPVIASCGQDNDEWDWIEQLTGLSYYSCSSIRLVLRTCENTTDENGIDLGVAHPNYDSNTGIPGGEIFPTSYLLHPSEVSEYSASNRLFFRYVLRRGDNNPDLQYDSQDALSVTSTSHIRRLYDNQLAGVRLPPTRYESGDIYTDPAAPLNRHIANDADHPLSLAGLHKFIIEA